MTRPKRGEIWYINFDPTIGSEIRKKRTAVVINVDSVGRLPLKIVIPITSWKDKYIVFPWFVKLAPNSRNGLKKISGADTFQIKSVSEERFLNKIGLLDEEELSLITYAIAICVGFRI